jgi:dTDP-4-amino-4,6-dideoxygalactose transaminase
MDEIMAIARRHGLFVIEDCAQAVGARYRGAPVGLLGDAATFSFYPTKNLGACGEAGALVSQRRDVFEKARQIRVHGMGQRYHHEIVGGNFRMEGFQGALLNVKLPHLPAWTERRREIAGRYLAGLRLAGAGLPATPKHGESVWHQFTITHPRRDALRGHLAARDVGTDLIYPVPLHLQPCFSGLGYARGSLPVSENVAQSCVSLPIFPELTDDQVDYVIEAANAFV